MFNAIFNNPDTVFWLLIAISFTAGGLAAIVVIFYWFDREEREFNSYMERYHAPKKDDHPAA